MKAHAVFSAILTKAWRTYIYIYIIPAKFIKWIFNFVTLRDVIDRFCYVTSWCRKWRLLYGHRRKPEVRRYAHACKGPRDERVHQKNWGCVCSFFFLGERITRLSRLRICPQLCGGNRGGGTDFDRGDGCCSDDDVSGGEKLRAVVVQLMGNLLQLSVSVM